MSRKDISLAGRLITSTDPLLIGGGQGDAPANFRQLTNMRYEDQNPQGVKGHTKINSTALTATGYVKTRSGFHFKKDFPSESHVVLQAENTGETASAILQNTVAVPSATGSFSLNYSSVGHTSDAIHTDTSSAGLGRFTGAPAGFLAYCNSAETMVWGGDESRVASFIRFDPDDNKKKWDYTDQISNTLTTDVATLVKSGGSLDANTVLLLHLDEASGNPDDASTSNHTVTNNGSMAYDATNKKFGDRSAIFDGSNDYLSLTDHANFDFSTGGTSGIFTFEFWMSGPAGQTGTVWYQEVDATNYLRIKWNYVETSGSFDLGFFTLEVFDSGGSNQTVTGAPVQFHTSLFDFHHIAVVGDGTNYYIFQNGNLKTVAAIVTTPEDYHTAGGNAYIGADNPGGGGVTSFLEAHIDEFRISSVARWISQFTPQAAAYPVNSAEVYLGSILPAQGVKFYVGTPNTTASTPVVNYWDGDNWVPVTNQADTTEDPAGDTLGQTGTISFDDTQDIAKPRSIDNQFLYWYRLDFPDLDDTTTVYHVSVDIPFQDIKDIWDGTYRTTLMALGWEEDKQTFSDHTTGVFEDRYESTDGSSFATTHKTWLNATDYLVFGFVERQTGLVFDMVAGKENIVTAAMTVEYWEGDGWVSVGTTNDNTVQDGKTLGKSGTVTWNSPAIGSEFKRQDLGTRRKEPDKIFVPAREGGEGGEDRPAFERFASKEDRKLSESIKKKPYEMVQLDYPLHVYKVSFNGDIESVATPLGVQIYHVGGISAQNDLKDYVFPSVHQNRLFLSNNTSQHKNEEICAAVGTVNVFNGEDATRFKYGGEEGLTAASTMYAQYKDQLSSIRAVFKANETWLLLGNSQQTWRKIQVSDTKGCVAPPTLQRFDVVVEGSSVQVLIFQGSNGIHMFDGRNVIDIHDDIRDIFDDGTINPDEIGNSTSFYDPKRQEYHWMWASGANTDLNKEYVFDVRRFKWFQIDRGTGAYLQCGYTVEDTDGNTFNYGMIDTGHAVRTENGTTFAKTTGSNEIAHTMWLGDFVPSFGVGTKLDNVNLIGKAVSETDTVTLTHYGDGKTAASTPAIVAETQVASGKRIYDARMSVQKGQNFSHSLKFEVTTGSTSVGFEPLGLSLDYKKGSEKGGR